jgi:hypothetical protein
MTVEVGAGTGVILEAAVGFEVLAGPQQLRQNTPTQNDAPAMGQSLLKKQRDAVIISNSISVSLRRR